MIRTGNPARRAAAQAADKAARQATRASREAEKERRRVAMHRHWTEETALFDLKPSDCPPCLAEAYTPPPGDLWFKSWPLACERRAELLKANPHHYDGMIDPAERKKHDD